MGQQQVSKEHLLLAVQNKLSTNKVEILSYKLESVEEKVGLLGDHAFVKVTVSLEDDTEYQDLRFFVKFFPNQPTLATFAEGAGSFPREEFIYDLIDTFKAHKIGIITSCVASCHFYYPNQYLIFDDLSEQGFRISDKSQCLDYDTLLIVLNALAQFHASSLIFEEHKSMELDKPFRILDGNEDRLKETLYSDCDDFTNKDTIDATLKCILTELEIFDVDRRNISPDFVELVYMNIYQLVKPSKNHRNVLCHGDLWASNFMLKYENNKAVNCKLVDLQSVRYVPPAHDVLSVIYLTTSKELREHRMYEAIGVYYSYLEKYLKLAGLNSRDVLSFEAFLEQCEEQKLFAVLFAAGILPLVLGDRQITEKYLCDPELYQETFRKDRSVLVYENQDSEWYIKRLKESMEDLIVECLKLR